MHKSLQYLLSNPPTCSSLDNLPQLDHAVTEGIESQISLFKRLIPQAKKLTSALNIVNEYKKTKGLVPEL